MKHIIIFDGECNLCDRSIQFIIKRDPKALYHFASIQGDAGREILKKHPIPAHVDSLILVEDDQFYFKSSAVLRICKNLNGVWKLCYGLLRIPQPLRDNVYDSIAKNRYKWFGKTNSCMLPSADLRKRFL